MRSSISLACSIFVTVTLTVLFPGEIPSAEELNDTRKNAIEAIIRDYILTHPEVIMQSVRGLQEQERRAEEERHRQAIITRQDELLRDPESPVGGNPTGDITVVEFFDYRCPHCKAVAKTIKELLRDDANIRLVYKDLPILGEESILAAKASLAARAQHRYVLFHDALMDAREPLNISVLLKLAAGVGLDIEKLKEEIQSQKVAEIIHRTRALAQAIGASSTPTFVIGDELIRGAVDIALFKQAINRARSRQNSSKSP